MSEEPDAYQTYLLHLWRVPCRGHWQWRASIESRQTCERQVFAGLEQLFALLSERCGGQEVETGRHGDTETWRHGETVGQQGDSDPKEDERSQR